MLSSSNLGQSGPHAHHAGFGSQLSSLAGFTHLTGYPDGVPQILYGPYIDYIAVAYGAVAILAALDYKRRTGRGNHIDAAQYETGLQYLAPILLDYKVNSRIAGRNANRDPYAAPHGAYPCKGDDSWCALSVHSESEWQALCCVMGSPGWATDEKFSSHEARKANEDELDRRIGEWTIGFTARELMDKLQSAGVRAAVVNTMKDVYSDPQLAQRPQWVDLEHPEIGKMRYQRPPFLLTKTPPGPSKRDPLLAEHNEYFYRDLLGLSEPEYNQLVEAEVIY
jgi:benzylsuccinate CoA-transferase BbsF subunit